MDKINFLHDMPDDIGELLDSNTQLLNLWNKLTPLAKNEWICWVTIVKKDTTRKEHLHRFEEDILKGKKRPCCWPGCPHRNKNSEKWFS